MGSLVELRRLGLSCYGVVRWVGWLPEHDRTGVGVEMEEELPGASNGWHKGSQLFGCAEGRAVFVPFTHVRPDARFREKKKGGRKNRDANGNDGGEEGEDDFGGLDCPAVTGFHRPIKVSSVDNLVAKVVGRNKGIQGHQNSCYLDATLFAMFSFTRYSLRSMKRDQHKCCLFISAVSLIPSCTGLRLRRTLPSTQRSRGFCARRSSTRSGRTFLSGPIKS